MRNYKKLMITAAIVGVLGTGFLSKPAEAFDKVKWKWNADVATDIDQNVDIDIDVNPTGLTHVENVQKQVGDVTAKSKVSHVTNKPVINPTGIDLPEVASTATAVGNNMAIESDVSVNLDNSQKLYGDVDAISEVAYILNASVDSAATAVGNNADINLAAVTPDDAMLIANIDQKSVGDIYAKSDVSNVTVKNYSNLAALTGPLVNSSATAVGNNVSIKVTAP